MVFMCNYRQVFGPFDHEKSDIFGIALLAKKRQALMYSGDIARLFPFLAVSHLSMQPFASDHDVFCFLNSVFWLYRATV